MNVLQSMILGVVQGLTEFLPISSTAHLLLTQYLFGWQIPASQYFIFDVLVQLGTLLALIIYFWADLFLIVKCWLAALLQRQPFSNAEARLGWYLILATLPALVGGFFFKDLLEQLFADPALAASIRLLITTVLLLMAEYLNRHDRSLESLNWKDALWTGLFQVLSVFPGASRSGSTITGGMTRRLERPAAARFAFLLSIPTMLAAGGYESLKLINSPDLSAMILPVVAGFITAAIVGYLAIRWLLGYLNRHSLTIFAVYTAVLGLAVLGLFVIHL